MEHDEGIEAVRLMADDCHRRGLSDQEAMREVLASGLLVERACPVCEGGGCVACCGDGVVFAAGKRGTA